MRHFDLWRNSSEDIAQQAFIAPDHLIAARSLFAPLKARVHAALSSMHTVTTLAFSLLDHGRCTYEYALNWAERVGTIQTCTAYAGHPSPSPNFSTTGRRPWD